MYFYTTYKKRRYFASSFLFSHWIKTELDAVSSFAVFPDKECIFLTISRYTFHKFIVETVISFAYKFMQPVEILELSILVEYYYLSVVFSCQFF